MTFFGGWAGAEMRVFALSQLDNLYGPTNQPTDRPTEGQSLLLSRLSATKKRLNHFSLSFKVLSFSYFDIEPTSSLYYPVSTLAPLVGWSVGHCLVFTFFRRLPLQAVFTSNCSIPAPAHPHSTIWHCSTPHPFFSLRLNGRMKACLC